MNSLDELLQSFNSLVKNEIDKLPLINSDDYNDSNIYNRQVGELPGLIYLGCFGLWLNKIKGLSPLYLPRINELSNFNSIKPSVFAKEVMQGVLFFDAINPEFQAFCEAYIKNTYLYGYDYQDYVVGELNLVDMSQVPDSVDVFSLLWCKISSRFAAYNNNDAKWVDRLPRTIISLTENEKNIDGWKASFAKVLLMDKLPHREREQAVAKFWTLVDHVHGATNIEIPKILVGSFTETSDSSLQEAVTRALYSMPFENVWGAIVDDALRLEKEGQLSSLLELWANDLTDDQLEYLQVHFFNAPEEAQNAIIRTAQNTDNSRNPWAYMLQDLRK